MLLDEKNRLAALEAQKAKEEQEKEQQLNQEQAQRLKAQEEIERMKVPEVKISLIGDDAPI